MESKVLEFTNENRIVLTNAKIVELLGPSQLKQSFDKMKVLAILEGNKYYWVYRLMEHAVKLYKSIEKSRVSYANEYCDKNTDGSLKFLEGEYQFEPDQKKLYDQDIAAICTTMTKENEDKLALLYCKKDAKGTPIKAVSNNLSFSDDNRKLFFDKYTKLMNAQVTFPINKVVINSELLEKMNNKIIGDIIDYNDMLALGTIFDFVE